MEEAPSVYVEKRRLLFAALPLTLTQYELTESTLSEKTGLFSVTAKEVAVEHLRGMEIRQSRLQTLLELCTIHVATSDPNLSEFVLHNVRIHTAFSAKLAQLVEKNSSLRTLVTE